MISHFHYTTWPDFGVPESPASFLNFLFKVRESGCLNPEHGPAVVHCSAGIGRSGTFSLVDSCLVLVSTWLFCHRFPSHALPSIPVWVFWSEAFKTTSGNDVSVKVFVRVSGFFSFHVLMVINTSLKIY